MSHADWAADVARRKAENERRRAREKAQRAREAVGGQEELTDDEEEEEEEEDEEVSEVPPPPPPKVRTAFPPHPQFAGWASQGGSPSGYSPSGYSPSPSPRWSASPLYVPAYADGDPHGGFNPNVAFAALPPHGYAGSPVHRRALPFASGGEARADARTLFGGTQGDSFMDELESTAAVASIPAPGFLSQAVDSTQQRPSKGNLVTPDLAAEESQDPDPELLVHVDAAPAAIGRAHV